jgi:hypothetical protein
MYTDGGSFIFGIFGRIVNRPMRFVDFGYFLTQRQNFNTFRGLLERQKGENAAEKKL